MRAIPAAAKQPLICGWNVATSAGVPSDGKPLPELDAGPLFRLWFNRAINPARDDMDEMERDLTKMGAWLVTMIAPLTEADLVPGITQHKLANAPATQSGAHPRSEFGSREKHNGGLSEKT